MTTTESVRLSVQGMTCASCVKHVETALKKTPGVSSANVNLAQEEAFVSFEKEKITSPEALVQALIQSVVDEGYSARVLASSHEINTDSESEALILKIKVILALAIAIILMTTGMIHSWMLPPVIAFALALPVQFWCGWGFLRGAVIALKNKRSNMDVLVTLGTLSAFVYSSVIVFAPALILQPDQNPEVYFEISASLIAFVLLGKWLERRARHKTGAAIEKLLQLSPKTATVIRDGKEMTLSPDQIQLKDQIRIRPGDRISTDAVVISGNSEVDESMLTGESMPVSKAAGAEVFAGTLNAHGTLLVEAKRTGKDTLLERIIAHVRLAQSSKAPIQRLADQVAAWFVPAILVIAAITFALRGLIPAIAVLVIACPCALGLATPTAIIAGIGRAAARGILFKSAEAIELLQKIKIFVFDKTGTLSIGKPELTDIQPLNGFSEVQCLELAASADSMSDHPVAQALVRAARLRNIALKNPEDFQNIPGRGIRAQIDGHQVLVGTLVFLGQEGIPGLNADPAASTCLAIDGKFAAGFHIADTPKPEAKSVVQALLSQGYRVVLLSGDRVGVAHKFAQQLGIKEVHAQVLPEAKADRISKLMKDGDVAMVGDGINDAPALSTATLGIAMGTGTDSAIEAAAVTLVQGNLNQLLEAIQISAQTHRIIRQNLFASLFYNSIGIPFAALGFLNPMIAGAAMAMSSISVVLNSLRLVRIKTSSAEIQ